MIKANELRIGNILYSNLTERNFACTSEDIYNLSIDCNVNNANYIPLTKEWLLKFGFIKIKFLNEYLVQEIGYKFNDMIIRYGCFEGHRFLFDFANEKVVNLKYVHQLQNLYFSIIGEELVFSSIEL